VVGADRGVGVGRRREGDSYSCKWIACLVIKMGKPEEDIVCATPLSNRCAM